MGLDLDRYRDEAEQFSEAIHREYYLHLAGRKPELELEPIYERHARLFDRAAVIWLREGCEALELGQDGLGTEEGRRMRYLLQFAFDGFLGRETRREAEELARREASMEVAAGGERLPYRGVQARQANEPRAEVRAELEDARDELLVERLHPLHLETLKRSHGLCRELGYAGYAAAYAELRGIDLERLGREADDLLRATDDAYSELGRPATGAGGDRPVRRAEALGPAAILRAPDLDAGFPPERLVPSLERTMAGLGIELGAQQNVRLDTEERATKSPRAFCAMPRVPQEVYLVLSPVGGRDDYAILFHEAGHAEHYGTTDPELPFEFRHLGDNSVTESFAFLLQHLTEDPDWLAAVLAIEDPEPIVAQARAAELVLIRRYAAKIRYELELHGPEPDLEALPDRYVELLGGATRVSWGGASWLADVDGGFYVACYLRAWALETRWRWHLRERFGGRWFTSAEAGEWVRGLWRQGQRLDADQLLEETLGERLELDALARACCRPVEMPPG